MPKMTRINSFGVFLFAALFLLLGISCTRTFGPSTPINIPPVPSAGCTSATSITLPPQYPSGPTGAAPSSYYAIRSLADWNNFYVDSSPIPSPTVDFTKYMILAFSEYSISCCPGFVDIQQVCFFSDHIEVNYNFREEGRLLNCEAGTCIMSLCVSNVMSAMVVPQSSLPITWIENNLCPPPVIPTPPPSGIYWEESGINVGSPYALDYAYISLSVNGAAEATAGVTLSATWPGISSWDSVPLNYISSSGPYAYYGASANFSFVPAEYALTTDTSIGSAAATLTTVQIPNIDPSGNTVDWSLEGNRDRVRVWRYSDSALTFDSALTSSDITSPFTIPGSAYPTMGEPYMIEADIVNQTTTVTGAAAGSKFEISVFSTEDVSK